MITKVRGIVLRTTRYGESSLVLHCYTEQYGRQTYLMKGVRRSKKQHRSNLFQALFVLDFELYYKEGADMHLVKEVTRAFPLNRLPYDIVRSTQAIFIAEVLYRVVREEEANPVLATYLINSIRYLDAMESSSPDFHIAFLFQLSKYLGFFPQSEALPSRPFFDMEKGQYVSVQGDPATCLNLEESRLWGRYMLLDFKDKCSTDFNGEQRRQVLELLMKYYRLHTDGMGEIRSLEVLHDFFHTN